MKWQILVGTYHIYLLNCIQLIRLKAYSLDIKLLFNLHLPNVSNGADLRFMECLLDCQIIYNLMASSCLLPQEKTWKNAINLLSVFALGTIIFSASIPSGNIIKPSRRLLHTACAVKSAQMKLDKGLLILAGKKRAAHTWKGERESSTVFPRAPLLMLIIIISPGLFYPFGFLLHGLAFEWPFCVSGVCWHIKGPTLNPHT